MARFDDLFIDFDDTLCDTHGNAVLALAELFQAYELDHWFSIPQVFYNAYWSANIDLWQRYNRGEISRQFLIEERFRRPLLESEELREALNNGSAPFALNASFLKEMSDYFLDRCAEKPGVVEGAHELVAYLRSRGYRLHLCSNGFHEVQYRKIHSCGMDGCFDTVILSEDAGANKPSRTYFDYAFSVSKAWPEKTLMIGDSWDSDICGALDYGLDTIYFNRYPEHPAPRPVSHEVHSLNEIMNIL